MTALIVTYRLKYTLWILTGRAMSKTFVNFLIHDNYIMESDNLMKIMQIPVTKSIKLYLVPVKDNVLYHLASNLAAELRIIMKEAMKQA